MRPSILLLCFLPLFLFAGCATTSLLSAGSVVSPYRDLSTMENDKIVHLPTGRDFTEDELIDFLGKFRVVYVGESHDSVDDHAVQLKILKRLEERFPGRIALGMEMLRTNTQEAADKWVSGEMPEKEFLRVWEASWGNWPYYAEIVRYAREAKIPLLALNRPKMMPAHAMGGEAASQSAEQAPPPPPEPPAEPEIDYEDPYYKAYIDAFFVGHGEGKPEVAQKFMKGQLLWDETMAETAAVYLNRPENAGKKLVVFAGGNHVRYGFGMPRRLFRRLPEPYVSVEPWVVKFPEEKRDKMMTEVHIPDLPLRLADFAWTVGYTDLEGKLVRLGVGIEPAKPEGVTVKSVLPKSSAASAGIEPNDIIVSIDGVAVKEMYDLTYEISTKTVGQKGTVTVLRGDEKKDLPIVYDVPPKHAQP
jgi:uncharacterized iron-regulated protein